MPALVFGASFVAMSHGSDRLYALTRWDHASAQEAAPLAGNLSLDEARQFTAYPIYSAGLSTEGLDMTGIVRVAHGSTTAGLAPHEAMSDAVDLTTVIYGTCEPRGTDEPSCGVPLAITSSSYCSRPIGQTAPEARDGAIFDFMGARAEWVSGSLVLHFGGSTVNVIATKDPRTTELRVGAKLIAENSASFSNARTSADAELGPVTQLCEP